MKQNNTNTKKDDKDFYSNESESISSSNNDFQIGNLFGLNGILEEDSSYYNNYSTTINLHSNSKNNFQNYDKRFRCQEEDVKVDFSNLSLIPDSGNEKSLDNDSIKNLFANICINDKKDKNESSPEKEFKILGKKRRTKSLILDSDSSEEIPSKNKDKV